MGDDPTEDVPPGPGPRGWRRFSIRSLMAAVVLASIPLAWYVNLSLTQRRLDVAEARVSGLIQKIQRDEPSLSMAKAIVGKGEFYGTGCHMANQYHLVTRAGRQLSITSDVRVGMFGDGPSTVTFESSGRSVTWPLADVEEGRTIDLRAEFPETFR